ncbi:hexokinase type 2 [Leptinotarsa decemlineata]|uniref:Phosphotransferase n=1 Tax=Leptinotarsa decemlineata TaxID=7539 RepID=A0A1W5YLK0_LEPDE|nr:hexokinase type 2 [Leptinotarsa decemlineata]ARI45062.1 hexokinase 2 isoform 2 [Leptinotarsa decemlineata]
MTSKCKSKVCNPPEASSGLQVTPEIVAGCQELILTDEQIQTYMTTFLDNIQRGLKKETHPTAIVKCFPTYVQDLPDGTESGKFLALDLGGSNFRVLLIELDGGNCQMQSKIFVISQDLMVGPGTSLFDFIAQCLAEFSIEHGVAAETLPLGFTFSFPVMQKGLTVGILERWTKGFSCDGVVGNDVAQMLKDAIARRGDVNIDVCAVLNDTTGTLMSCAWKNRNTRIGLIVGTGTNGCYVEKQSEAELFDEPDMGSGNVIINLEWGAFGDDGALDFCRVKYDVDIDKRTINPGKQLHEKMISGMYMGELVRLAAERFTKEGYMFEGKGSEKLFTPDSFETKFVSEIESDPPGTYVNIKKICDGLDLINATEQDFVNLRFLCECISKRAAHLVSAGLIVLMRKIGEKKVAVGIDGTVYKYHPHFHNLMVEKIKQLIEPDYEFELILSEDGSGRGAALVAAVAARVKSKPT